MDIETQICVIGGGIIGTAIAHELSKYKLDVCLIEKRAGIGQGITKSGQGLLHSGLGLSGSKLVKWWDRTGDIFEYLNQPLAHKEKLNIAGNKIYDKLEPLLNARIRRMGRVMVTDQSAEISVLEAIKKVAESRGFRNIVLMDRNELLAFEPALDSRFIAGLYDPSESIIMASEWAIAFADNARDNGVHIHLGTEVQHIQEKGGVFELHTNQGLIKTRFVVNCAGLFADEIAAMLEPIDFSLILHKSQQMIMENHGYLSHMVSEVYKPARPRALVPTPDDNIIAVGIVSDSNNKNDLTNTRDATDQLLALPGMYLPEVPVNVIRTYAGFMHTDSRNPEDYVISWSRDRFLNLVTCAPGCGPAPALAQEVAQMLGEHGLELTTRVDYNPYRAGNSVMRDLDNEEKNRKIQQCAAYGHLICRCEKVSEQEVRDAVKSGARTLDDVKFRVRTGMGRCQGSFCTPRVLQIIAEELNISPLEVTQSGGGSYILASRTKTESDAVNH